MSLEIDFDGLEASKEHDAELPGFAEIEPEYDLDKIDQDFNHLIVIGNGGSITSLRALYYTFLEEADRHLDIVSTMDPDRLNQVIDNTSQEDTLVMPISKSGSTVGVIESLMFFINRGYDFNPLTTPGSPLHKIAERFDREIIKHQDVGGRFSGLTNTALAPAELIGLESDVIQAGGKEGYRMKQEAMKTAQLLLDAEEKGFDQVLTPFYSSRMFGFYPLFVQLMHETVCKDGQGQTFFGDHAPEYQHHTNQRLFGGKKDILPFFFRTNHRNEEINVPKEISDVEIKGRALKQFDGTILSQSLEAEYLGVKKALEEEDMPYIDLKIENSSYKGFGQLMAFLQLVAFYSAELRGVEPLNQPDVEKSKKLGLEERFG